MSYLNNIFEQGITIYGLPMPTAEYRFYKPRKWRLDYAYVDKKLAIELEGGCWVQGRHSRGSGFVKDCEKYNRLAIEGWRLLRYHAGTLKDGTFINDLKEVLNETK